MLKRFIFIAVVIPILISKSSGEIEKRQVGMLARSGELPSRGGKRSVGALARNGELPGKRTPLWDSDEHQRLRLLSNWLKEMDAAITLEQALQHDVAKRNMEAMARAGYLIKPATEAPEPRTGFLDSDEFLGKLDDTDDYGEYADGFGSATKRGGLAALARQGYIGKRDDELDSDAEDEIELESYPSAAEKRHLAAVKSFISRFAKRNIGAYRNFGYGKRHIGAARNFALVGRDADYDSKRNVGSARRFTGKRNLGAARNFQFRETKKNLGAAKQFFAGSSKKNVGAARGFMYGKRNLASLARDGGIPSVKYLGHEDDYPWEENQFDFDDFHDEEKRNLASYVKSLHGKRYLGSLRAGKRAATDGDDASLPLASVLADTTYENLPEFPGVDHEDASSAIAKRETKDGEAGQGQGHGNASRRKRSAEYALSGNELPVDLQEYADYEDAVYPNVYEKRFLGESADSWAVNKRHIGALARMGLLPSFRNTRYSRSGRAVRNRIVPFREDPPIRSCPTAKDSTTPWSKTPSVTSQLVIRSPERVVAFAPFGSRARHPMAFHKSYYL